MLWKEQNKKPDTSGVDLIPVDSGHFALEDRCAEIAEAIKSVFASD